MARVPNLLFFLPTPTGCQLRMATEQVGTEGLREAGNEEIRGPLGRGSLHPDHVLMVLSWAPLGAALGELGVGTRQRRPQGI